MTAESDLSGAIAKSAEQSSPRGREAGRSVLLGTFCALAFSLGALAMAGWIWDRSHWRSVVPGGSEMKANTALCLTLLPLALFLLHHGLARIFAQVLAGIVALVALLTLWEYASDSTIGIDEFLFRDTSIVGTSHPGRMSPPTAVIFLFGAIGTLVLRIETRAGHHPAQWLALAMAFVPMHILTSYAYGNMTVLAFGSSKSYMAVPTAVALLSLASAILFHAPDRGLMHTLTAQTPPSRVFRWLLVVLLLAPPLIGWFVLRGLDGSSSPPEYGVSTTVMLCITVLAVLGWRNAAMLNRAELALQASEAAAVETQHRLEAILNNSPIVVWAVDRDGIFTFLEGQGLQAQGYQRDELLGKSIFTILAGDASLTNTTRRAMRGEITSAENSFEGRWFENRYAVLWSAPGQSDGMVAVSTDITARKEAERLAVSEQAARETSRLKSEFLANMSHEIRTPMNSILGMTTLLKKANLEPQLKEMVELIDTGAEGLMTIINDILDLSKIEAGKMRLVSADFNLRQVIEETVNFLLPRARDKQIELRCEIGPLPFAMVNGDAGRIRQILTNLVGNAVKFTARGEVVVALQVVSSTASSVQTRIEVRDTGIGIDPALRERLFQPFTQAESIAASGNAGTGLGLSICRQLASLMNATVDFESVPGEGSKFWLMLNLQAASVPETNARGLTAVQRSASPCVAYRSLNLLVVDDHRANQKVAQMLLGSLGHDVTTAGHGREALDLLPAQRFDAILMDCRMPTLDGYETTREIRAGKLPGVDPRIPIIALTAYALPTDREECLSAGMDEYVSKPLRVENLADAFLQCGLCLTPRENIAVAKEIPSDAVIDPEQMDRLRRLPGLQGPSLLPELIEAFLEEMPGRMADLAKAVEARGSLEVAELAHTLAGSCATFQAKRLRTLALSLEHAARREAWDRAVELYAELQAAGGELETMLCTQGQS